MSVCIAFRCNTLLEISLQFEIAREREARSSFASLRQVAESSPADTSFLLVQLSNLRAALEVHDGHSVADIAELADTLVCTFCSPAMRHSGLP
jgi:hypothetical protein